MIGVVTGRYGYTGFATFPFAGQEMYNSINVTNKTSDPSNSTVVSSTLKVLPCPSEPNQHPFTSGTSTFGVSNYGFTTALPPNTKVLVAPGVDVDVNTADENNGGPTYAAVTARSYHPGGVNSLFGDGSVRFIKDSIKWATWRAVGTIASGEIVSSDFY